MTIEMRSWNIKASLIEKVSYPDKLTTTIRKSYILSLSWRHSYCLLLAAYSECDFISYKSKVTSHRFTRFWILYPVWIRVCYNIFIAKSIIDYLILASIKQISTEMQFSLIMLIWGICHLLNNFDYSQFYIRIWANY